MYVISLIGLRLLIFSPVCGAEFYLHFSPQTMFSYGIVSFIISVIFLLPSSLDLFMTSKLLRWEVLSATRLKWTLMVER